MFASGRKTTVGVKYVDRGDPAAWDFIKTDLTLNGTWQELDLSAIVPVGVTEVFMHVGIDNASANKTFELRKNGRANAISVVLMRTQVADLTIFNDFLISCDADRKIEYKAVDVVWTSIYIVVTGWIK